MALNLKNRRVEQLAAEVAERTGETKTEAVRRALEERLARLDTGAARRAEVDMFWRYLESEVWPHLPPGERGRRLSREEEDEILGYGRHGV